MTSYKRTSKRSDEKIPIFAVGDIVKIITNHKPYTRNLSIKYPHGKELINHVCFVEQVLGDRYSLYAIEKPVKRKWSYESWYVGDLIESCLEPHSIKCEDCNDLINKMPFNAIKDYKHFIYPEDLNKMLRRMKAQDDLT